MESLSDTFVLTDLSHIPDNQAPSLCEIWNWQGDTSWVEVLNAVCGQEEAYSTKMVKSAFVQQADKFDPNAFFFITYRSHAIGLCLAWPTEEKEYEIKHLCSVPSQRNKGVEEALLSLVLAYCRDKGAQKVTIKFDEQNIYEYQSKVLKPIILEKFGFKNIQ